jgi:hypothetical protein
MTTSRNAPAASVVVVPRSTGVLNSSAWTGVVAGKPLPVITTLSPGDTC